MEHLSSYSRITMFMLDDKTHPLAASFRSQCWNTDFPPQDEQPKTNATFAQLEAFRYIALTSKQFISIARAIWSLDLQPRGPGSSHLKCSFVVIVWPFLVTQKQSYQLNWELASAPDCKETDPDQWWSAENDLGPCQEHLGRTTLLKGALLQ